MAETEEEKDFESYKKLCRLWDHVRDIEYDQEFYRVNDVEKINREMEKIIEKGGDNNYQFSSDDVITMRHPELAGYTALHLVAGQNNDTIINVLLSKPGIDFTVKNHSGSTALHVVVEKFYKSYWRSIKDLSQNKIVNAILSAHVKLDVFDNPCNKDGISHLHIACMTNNAAAVEFFISKGISVNQVVDGDFSQFLGYTPLHFAVDFCALETVEVLLRSGADVDKKDAKGMSPVQLLLEKIMSNVDSIHSVMSFEHMMNIDLRHSNWCYKLPRWVSAVEADKQIMELLLRHMMGLKKPLETEDLPVFHIACVLQNTSLIEQLLTEIEDINHCVKMDSTYCPGYTASHFAAYFDPKILKYLTQRGASLEAKDANGVTPLDICLGKYKVRDLHCILSSNSLWRNLLVSDNKTKLLDVVFAMKDSNTLEEFLKGVESYQSLRVPNDSPLWPGYTLLHLAVTFSETIKIITDHEETSDYYEKDEFEKLEREYIERIEVCLNYGADITAQDARGWTALHLAHRLQKAQVVKLFSEHHTDIVNSIDEDNLSYQNVACAVNYPRVLKKLLADDNADVNVTIKSRFKWPLIKNDYVTATSQLRLESATNSNVNPVDADGVSHFHTACLENDLAIMKKLLGLNVDVNQSIGLHSSRFPGCSPLHLVLQPNYNSSFDNDVRIEAIDLLVRHGADVHAKDLYENTAFHVATKCSPPRKQLLEKIFSIGTDIRAKNIYDEEPLGMLMSSRKFEYADIKFFLEHHCHPNLYEPIRDQGCLTFLFGNDHPIRKIVKAPSITTIDDLGRNAIHNIVSWEFWVRTKSYYQIIPMLMVRGCNIDHKDNLGRTPLHLAVKFNNDKAVKDLLGAGADINVTNAKGESPFSLVFSLSENSRYEGEYERIVMPMAMHICKLQITGLHVSDLNAESLEELLKKRSLDEEKIKGAKDELAKMKDLKIESTLLSPFDFFLETGVIVNLPHMPLSEQQAIDEFFTSMKKRDFPELGYLLKIRYEKALKRPGCLCFFGKKLIRTGKLLRSNNRKLCV